MIGGHGCCLRTRIVRKRDVLRAVKELGDHVQTLMDRPPKLARVALTPVDRRRLKILLLTLHYDDVNVDTLSERKRRKLLKMLLRLRKLRRRWNEEMRERMIAFGYPKKPQLRHFVRLERAVSKLVRKLRKDLKR